MIRRQFSQMTKIFNALIGVLFIYIIFSCATNNNAIDKIIAEKLDPIISDYLTKFDLPGLAVGVVVDNKTIYAKGFGVESIETGKRVSPKTLFHMASDSKPFVATAIMQLVEQGKINLNVPVVTYLPYFKLDDERYLGITINQMLKHSSGIADINNYEWGNPQFDDGALERYTRNLSDKQLLFEPDSQYSYSNIAYNVLGDVIQKVSGMSFEDYEKEHILNKAGMQSSTFLMPSNMQNIETSKPEYLPDGWASPHMRALKLYVWEIYPYNRIHVPSGTLHSNALEMCNWAITNMKKGRFNKNRILQPQSYDLLWEPYFATGRNSNFYRHSGFTWFIGEYRGERTISHGGGDTGFNTYFVMLPDKNIAVVLLCNILPAPLENINNAILYILLGYEPEPPRPAAFIPVRRTLADKGVEAAVEQWNRLKTETEAGNLNYNFGERQVGWTIIDMPDQRVEEAVLLAKFCKKVLPEFTETAIYLIERSETRKNSPAGKAMLEILKEQ